MRLACILFASLLLMACTKDSEEKEEIPKGGTQIKKEVSVRAADNNTVIHEWDYYPDNKVKEARVYENSTSPNVTWVFEYVPDTILAHIYVGAATEPNTTYRYFSLNDSTMKLQYGSGTQYFHFTQLESCGYVTVEQFIFGPESIRTYEYIDENCSFNFHVDWVDPISTDPETTTILKDNSNHYRRAVNEIAPLLLIDYSHGNTVMQTNWSSIGGMDTTYYEYQYNVDGYPTQMKSTSTYHGYDGITTTFTYY